MITVPVPAGVTIPEGAVQVPNSFLIWRDGLVVVAILPTGEVISHECQTEGDAVLLFTTYAYLH
jgi:hypothetical protein